MAKGQKRSSREVRKPKQPKAKPVETLRSFLQPVALTGRPAVAPRSRP